MADDNGPRVDSRHQLPILLGIVGAVLGYVGTVALLIYLSFNTTDPQTTFSVIVFFVGPIGAVIGAFAGAKFGALLRPPKPPAAESPAAVQTGARDIEAVPPASSGGEIAGPTTSSTLGAPAMRSVPQASAGAEIAGPTTSNALKSLGIVIAVTAVVLGGWAFYEYQATPWLRPGNQYLLFEVRLPAGAAMPNPRDGVKVNLRQNLNTMFETRVNTMPADMERATFRQEGDRVVIAGEIALAYRASDRQVEVTIPRRQMQTYPLKLASSPRHMKQLTAWEKHSDGSEIRYRVKWPGED
ncbi:MAG TPA: hypothetical protein VJQ55_16815 [Candidatus Binatia bacterium]|nr:hypothetical protein [Candidatus Binatia bacterium]